MSNLTTNESSILIWALLGLVGIVVGIGWFYIKVSIREQKEMAKNIFEIRLMQHDIIKDITAVNKEHESMKEDIQDVREDIEVLTFRANDGEKQIAILQRK